MVKSSLKYLLIILLYTNLYTLYGQEEYDTIVVSDLETWHNVQFEYKFNKKFKVGISEHIKYIS